MASSLIALFGEAEKGKLETFYYCSCLGELFDRLGEPPKDAQGLHFAVQSLLFGMPILYFRVREEGENPEDYFYGLHYLRKFQPFSALFLPKVGSKELLDEGFELCREHQSLLIVTACDFYDFMTDFRFWQ
jgi:hypothetical protein